MTNGKDSAALEGTQGSQPEGSKGEAGQQGSGQPEFVTVEQFKLIQTALEETRRLLQGDKDRAVKKTNERLDGVEKNLKEVLQLAKRDGKSVEDLLNEVESNDEAEFRKTMKDIAVAFQSGKFPTQASRGSEDSQGVNVSEVLSALELDIEDARVKAFAGRKFESKEQALLEGAKLVKTILSKQPTDADKPGGEQDRTVIASKQERLMNEYREGSKNLYGQQLIQFKMEMRKKGLAIS